MAELATKRMCKDVQAIYFYDMIGKYIVICAFLKKQVITVLDYTLSDEMGQKRFILFVIAYSLSLNIDDEKFYVDWKNGKGEVNLGYPPMDKKPDVTFTLKKEWLLKVLNRK